MANPQEVAYIKINLTTEAKEFLHEILMQIVNEGDFYTSPVMEHINGDVTAKSHLTLYFGLDASVLGNREFNELINNIRLSTISLGNFILMNGYQNLYKVLTIEVKDEDLQLNNIVDQIKIFDSSKVYIFKPHITLAYVNSRYALPANLPKVASTLPVEQLKISIFENIKRK